MDCITIRIVLQNQHGRPFAIGRVILNHKRIDNTLHHITNRYGIRRQLIIAMNRDAHVTLFDENLNALESSTHGMMISESITNVKERRKRRRAVGPLAGTEVLSLCKSGRQPGPERPGLTNETPEIMTSPLVLFEHDVLPFDWQDRHLRLLERARLAHGSDVLTATTRGGKRVLKAHHYVGTLRLGDDTFTILPKIDYGDDLPASAARNLLYMLEQAGYLPPHHQSLAPLLQRGGDWFELLTRIFAVELLAQWTRGPHRLYQLVEDTLPVLRGKLQTQRQARQPARDHRFDVAFDEFTTDNALSRVLRYVIEQLWRRARNADNRRLLDELRQLMDSVSLEPHLTAAAIPPGLINRLNARYEPLLNLARLFLNNESLELARGDAQTFAFTFNMNELFEAFLVGFIRRHWAAVIPPVLQDCVLHPQARHHARHLARNGSGVPVFRLRPDMAFRRGSDFPLLVDAKYKMLSDHKDNLGVSQSDFYQMFAYVHRYGAPRVLLLYPQIATAHRVRFDLLDHPATVSVATVNLRRDLSRKENQRALAGELSHLMAMETDNGN